MTFAQHLSLAFSLAATPLFATSTVLTLEGSIEAAQSNATSVLQAQNNDAAAAAGLIKGYAQFLPNLQGQLSFGYEKGNRFSATGAPTLFRTESFGLNYQITTTLNLFNGLSDFAGLKSAIDRREFAALTLNRAKQLIALDVAQAFLQVILDRKLVAIAKSALDASKAQENLVSEQVKVGSGKPSDLASVKSQTSSNQSLLLSVQNQERSDLLLLLQKLRLDANGEYDLQEPSLKNAGPDSQYGDENALIGEALTNRSDLRAAQRSASAAGWDVTAAQAGFWPALNAQFALYSNSRELITQSSAGTNYVPPAQAGLFNQLGANNYYDITLNLSWTLFDQWTTPKNVAVASATARNLRINAQDQERQVSIDVKKGLLDYRTGAALVESTSAGANAAQEAYNLVKGRFDAGIVNFAELQLAQATLIAAQSAKAQALISFDLKQRALETALGR